MVLLSKLLCLAKELGLKSVRDQLNLIYRQNKKQQANVISLDEFDFLNEDSFDYTSTIFDRFMKIVKETYKNIKELSQINKEKEVNSKVHKLVEYLNSSAKHNLKVIVFITMKYIVINLQKLLKHLIKNTLFTIAINSKSNQSLVKKLPHQLYLNSMNQKSKLRPQTDNF